MTTKARQYSKFTEGMHPFFRNAVDTCIFLAGVTVALSVVPSLMWIWSALGLTNVALFAFAVVFMNIKAILSVVGAVLFLAMLGNIGKETVQ